MIEQIDKLIKNAVSEIHNNYSVINYGVDSNKNLYDILNEFAHQINPNFEEKKLIFDNIQKMIHFDERNICEDEKWPCLFIASNFCRLFQETLEKHKKYLAYERCNKCKKLFIKYTLKIKV
jgi:hypothetical protein